MRLIPTAGSDLGTAFSVPIERESADFRLPRRVSVQLDDLDEAIASTTTQPAITLVPGDTADSNAAWHGDFFAAISTYLRAAVDQRRHDGD